MDAIVQALAHFFSVDMSARIFLILMFFLLAFAPFALSLAINGRVTLVALFGLLFVHNETVSLGFVPYLFSLGFGLCLLALWIRTRERGRLGSGSHCSLLWPLFCSSVI